MMCAEAVVGATLSSLLRGIAAVPADMDFPVSGMTSDSRAVRPGDVFFALVGKSHHGLDHVAQAARAGARMVLWEPPGSLPTSVSVPCIPVEALGRHVGTIADRFYGEPSAAQRVVGVTGTDGKTSCAHFIAQALSCGGKPCGLVGTLGYGLLGALEVGAHTTPDAVSVHRILAAIRDAGGRRVAMEVSSHGLDQGRVDGVRFDTAVLTNLTRDHLDYHGTVEAYGEAKARLFRRPGLRTAILNLDDALGTRIAGELSGVERIGYTLGSARVAGARHLVAERIALRHDGVAFRVAGDFGEGWVDTGLFGEFNVGNLLAVLAVLLTDGMELSDALRGISRLATVPGRMQRLGGLEQPLVVVDYAHTPNSLRHVLSALRAHGRGRLICVFGCGGDRDRGKRPQMAQAAETLSDFAIVTDDNPRGEDPREIVADILAGFSGAVGHEVVHHRGDAIARALALAGSDDTVLVAGKGHEDYQLVGIERLHFSDAETVEKLLGGRA